MRRLGDGAAVCGMVALYVSSRLPLVRLGFGNDSDAWSMASNASDVVHGTHRVSRLPGHPVYEALYSTAAVLGGSLVCNLLTVGLSLIVLAVVGRLGGTLGVDRPGWAVAAIATRISCSPGSSVWRRSSQECMAGLWSLVRCSAWPLRH